MRFVCVYKFFYFGFKKKKRKSKILEPRHNKLRLKVLEKLVSGLKVTTALPLFISIQVKAWSVRENLPGVDVISTSPISLFPVGFFFKIWIPPYVLIVCWNYSLSINQVWVVMAKSVYQESVATCLYISVVQFSVERKVKKYNKALQRLFILHQNFLFLNMKHS